jgi:type I restriction enzyme M protein
VLTNPQLRSQVDQVWDKLWTGGLSNPLDAIEQFSYLLFLKRLDDDEIARERAAKRNGQPFQPSIDANYRWGSWTNQKADGALKFLKDQIFPWLRTLSDSESSFARYMQNAECKINKAGMLIEICRIIDGMNIAQQNQDVQGDLYEYMLGKLDQAGRNGQFRTPRHIIRMMVQMIDPQPGERIGDLAAGTGGFLVNAYQHILEQHTPADSLSYDADGWPHGATGAQLTDKQRAFLQQRAFRGYDNDSGMTMLRIGSMNLMLHGIRSPRFFYTDTLSKAFAERRDYDVILMNPPFKGAVDKADVAEDLQKGTTKSELLFLHLILEALDSGGRCAVIVPDGVLFGSSKAHVEARKRLITENGLAGVVSMPSGVFKPYAGVSTAVLFFTKNAATDRIWFYDMEHDGFSLDDKRQKVAANDIPDLLTCWQNRHDAAFQQARAERLAELRAGIAPLKASYLTHQAAINRLQFERAIAPDGDSAAAAALERASAELNELHARLNPLQTEINQLTRQFWVTKKQVEANKYDLSASRYRQVERDEVYYEVPAVTIERLLQLEQVMRTEAEELIDLL